MKPLLRQIWTMSSVLINMFGQGMVLAYPASLLPALNHPDSSIKADLHSSSWLGSIVGVSGIPGFLITSVLMVLYGRKLTHALAILPAIVGLLLIYFANGIPMLMIGRFCNGLTATPTVSLGAIVMGEYTSPKYRGVFLCLKNASVCMGAMCMHVLSQYLHWRTNALVTLIPIVSALLITFAWPESPSWLASNHRYRKSQEAFYWLRGDTEESRREIENIIKVQRTTKSKQITTLSCCEKSTVFLKKLAQKDFLKPSLIMMLATAVLELSGRHIFPSYALQIMPEITGAKSHWFYYTLAIDVIFTASAVFATVLVKIMSRRTLLFSSGFAAVAVLMVFCLYLFLASKDIIVNDKSWIPIILLVLYFILANLGCSPIPLALVGEVFPLAHRGSGSTLSGVWIAICLLAGLKSTPHLLVNIGVNGFFFVYGSIMAVALFLLYFIMPETKDRTLQEIENYFNYGKFTNEIDEEEEADTKMMDT